MSTTKTTQRDHVELEKRRLKAGRMFTRGKSQYAVAKYFGVSTAATNQWYKAWKKNGNDGLKSKGHPGFKSQYTEEKKEELKRIILKGPAAYGYTTNFWTVGRIGAVAKKKLGVKLETKQTWSTVVSLGFSCQKPAKRAQERDEKSITDWKHKTFPRLKKMGAET